MSERSRVRVSLTLDPDVYEFFRELNGFKDPTSRMKHTLTALARTQIRSRKIKEPHHV